MQPFSTGAILLISLVLSGCRPPPATPTQDIRIVSLAPSLTESLCAIGAADLIVGRTSVCDFPPEAIERIPVIGGFGTPSLELLARAEPTLVLDTALADETVATQITRMGIRHHRIRCKGLDDIVPMLRELGTLTGHQAEADALASSLADAIDQARANLRLSDFAEATTDKPTADRRSPVSVYAEVWHDPMTTIGSHTFLADLIRLAGGRPIADSVKKDYFQIGPEQVIAENPDIILCLYMGPSDGAAEMIRRRSGWEHINAVKSGHIFDQLHYDVLLRPGPRLLEGLAALRDCVRQAQQGAEHDL
ncbi:MAG: helical backbone metal receptor [Kiritimatiellia bacterium]|jgi:iron complex transport system substrate-binding protein|nr:helical backbone metal receptor [Kiritimatiellia bacterium]MDP6630139.1 helical backbone metal receptor [Kiritimatiellia bacterium]MDP6810640.1 helical backbone metal receptor [Kiritimatiellia bacterium]MDP7023725.1 helical backbone metal receptor [Kiritimatiellia bacterium]